MANAKTQKRFKFSKKISIGVLLILILAVAAGCSSQKASETAQLEKTSTASPSSQSQDTAGKMQDNPAVQAAMNILRLQRNTEVALTSAQCTSIKPILEELIAAADPSDEFLQTKADVITKLFTEEQNTFLSQKPEGKGQGNEGPPADAGGNPPTPPDGSNPPGNGTPPEGGAPPDNGQSPNLNNSGTDANNANTQDTAPKPAAMEPTEVYKQALDALE